MKDTISVSELILMNHPTLGKAGDFSDYSFWHYTSCDTACKILENHCFHVRNMGVMNDLNEKERHSNCSSKVHLLCFCNSKTEKIPMWYLYAGLLGNGVSIGFTPKTMIDFIQSIKSVSDVNTGKELQLDKDFELRWGWVFYQNGSDVRYRNKWYTVSDVHNFNDDNFFIKDYPWEYEREFRIVIVNKTNESFESIKVNIPEKLYGGINARVAPENTEKSYEQNEQLKKTKRVYLSRLKIKMDLCSRNKKDILEYCVNNADEKETKDICAAIKNRQMCKQNEENK